MHSEMIAVTSRSFSRSTFLCQQLKQHFANIRFNEKGIKLTDGELIEFLSGADGAIIGLEKIDEALLEHLPNLKFICKVGTGIDKIDLTVLEKRQIKFAATPGVNKRSVSELVLGLIFVMQRHLLESYTSLKKGIWQQPIGNLLSNKTVGIIGFGAIGRDLASLLSVFDCKCLVYDIQIHQNLLPYVQQVDLDYLLKNADIISLHIPLLPENYHFLSYQQFSKMKKGAILINTARGSLIDEEALFEALYYKQIGAAALDVFESEPAAPRKLLELDNFFATSHIGGSTEEAIQAMGMMAIEQLKKLITNMEIGE